MRKKFAAPNIYINTNPSYTGLIRACGKPVGGIHMFDCTITISEAAEYSGSPPRKLFDGTEQGLVSVSPGPPGNLQSSDYTALAAVCRIPVSSLPRHASLQFCQERILHESYHSFSQRLNFCCSSCLRSSRASIMPSFENFSSSVMTPSILP